MQSVPLALANNKQSVPLALAEKTTAAIRSYLVEGSTTADLLQLVHIWWLLVNSKERYHPDPIGNAITSQIRNVSS